MMNANIGELAGVAGQTVLVRASFDEGIAPEFAPRVRELADQGARVAIIAGLGNPAGDVNPALSLGRFSGPLSQVTGRPVTFIPESVGIGAEASLAQVPFGEIALLENLRFHPDESRQARVFAVRLSVLGDFYIDAGNVPAKGNGWQSALRLLLPEPCISENHFKIDEEA
jgi:phosphoglycerate kinase